MLLTDTKLFKAVRDVTLERKESDPKHWTMKQYLIGLSVEILAAQNEIGGEDADLLLDMIASEMLEGLGLAVGDGDA